MNDVVAKIRAALDEDDRVANQMPPFPWKLNSERDEVLAADGEVVCAPHALSSNQTRNMAAYIARHDPARVLRQVAAHRKILEIHERGGHGQCIGCNWTAQQDYETDDINSCPTLLALAETYNIEG